MDEQQRDFKGVWLPKEIWLNEDLTMIEKVILMEIDSLDNKETGCFASNKHFAELCNCTEKTVSLAISKLQKFGLIEIVKFDGRTRYCKSRLEKMLRQPLQNVKADFTKSKGSIYSNTINNTYSNTIINNIVGYLNEKAHTNFKTSSQKTKKLISTRLREGFTEDDFKTVIDKKCAEWLKDNRMCKYLRPETLFGSKFEGYLNQQVRVDDLITNSKQFKEMLERGIL